METNRPSEEHSLPGDEIGRDLSGHRKKSTERKTLTNWRWQRKGLVRTRKKNRHSKGHSRPGDSRGWELVRTWKQTDRPRGTHTLETPEGGSCQGTEQNQPSEGHSLPGDARGRGLSGNRKKPIKRRALTSWRRKRDGLVRTRKEIDRLGTHSLGTAEG